MSVDSLNEPGGAASAAPASGKEVPVALSAVILGVGGFVPERVLTNDELSLTLDTSDAWIRPRTGIVERRLAPSDWATSDLAIPAARAALESAGVTEGEIDYVLCGTLSPDMLFPSTAGIVSHALGCDGAGAYDLSAACSGFMYALLTAASYVSSGLAHTVLVLGADANSALINWEDRNTAILFGDGGGAVVVGRSRNGGGFLGSDVGNDARGARHLQVPAGGSRSPASVQSVLEGGHTIQQNGREVFKFATRKMVESAGGLLERCGVEPQEVTLFIAHQANLRIIEYALEHLQIPRERTVTTLEHYGNTSNASIPLCLEKAVRQERLSPGDLVLLTAVGGGLSWASALIRWE